MTKIQRYFFVEENTSDIRPYSAIKRRIGAVKNRIFCFKSGSRFFVTNGFLMKTPKWRL
jgi:hypothetical protein